MKFGHAGLRALATTLRDMSEEEVAELLGAIVECAYKIGFGDGRDSVRDA